MLPNLYYNTLLEQLISNAKCSTGLSGIIPANAGIFAGMTFHRVFGILH